MLTILATLLAAGAAAGATYLVVAYRVTVVVTTANGVSIRGRRRPSLLRMVLTNAEVLDSKGATSLPGRFEIPRRQVVMVQVLAHQEATES